MRISTAAANQSALMDLMRAQRDSYEAGRQVASGRKAEDLKGYGYAAETILASRSALKRTESFITAGERLTNRLQVQDLAFRELSDAATDLREALTTSEATYLMNDVRDAFEKAKSALNTRYNGTYIFGGTRTDARPFTGETLADLQAAGAIDDLFENSDRAQTAVIEEGQTVQIGFLADDLGRDLMAAFERIAEFDATSPDGPFDGQVSAAQQAFLQTEIDNVIQAFERINDRMGENGSLQARLENTIQSQRDRRDYLVETLGRLEDVDIAEAASRLNQAQTAVQVSARTFSTLSQVSLLPFLR